MISEDVSVGEGSVIMPNVFIGSPGNIGKNCVIYPNVSLLDYTVIGDEVIIQSGSVIGSDAFTITLKRNVNYGIKECRAVVM